MPHHLTIDLGRAVTLNGITYLPRQDGANGRIAECEIYCSTEPNAWAAPTAKVKWPNTDQLQTVNFNATGQSPLPESRRPVRGEPKPLRQHRRAGCPHRREIVQPRRPSTRLASAPAHAPMPIWFHSGVVVGAPLSVSGRPPPLNKSQNIQSKHL